MQMEKDSKEGERPNITKAKEKLFIQLMEITKNDSFAEAMEALREKYKIPKGGYKKKVAFEVQHLPVFPKEWLRGKEKSEIDGLIRDIGKFCEKCEVPSNVGSIWFLTFKVFLFYNVVEPPITFDMCKAYNVRHGENVPAFVKEWIDADEINYPVRIMIDPYATKRDILDYVGRNYKTIIEEMQKTYRRNDEVIGKTRHKDGGIWQRNQFVYKNRNLPYEEIRKKVAAKFEGELGIVDSGLIGKIISRMKDKDKLGQ
ncbi:MAG: hypothetical protein WC178_04230 [Candidatus Paceibacterota bacterium]